MEDLQLKPIVLTKAQRQRQLKSLAYKHLSRFSKSSQRISINKDSHVILMNLADVVMKIIKKREFNSIEDVEDCSEIKPVNCYRRNIFPICKESYINLICMFCQIRQVLYDRRMWARVSFHFALSILFSRNFNISLKMAGKICSKYITEAINEQLIQ